MLTKRAIDAMQPGKPQYLRWDGELPGFGVLVGARAKTYVLQRRGRRITIGRHGPWTLDQARKRARELIVEIDKGNDPVADKKLREARGITLCAALEEHLARLAAKGGAERTAKQMRSEVALHLGDWARRPLSEITKQACRDRHRRLTEGSGPYLANRVLRHVRAVYNSALKVHDLPALNPTVGVEWNKQHRRQEPISWADLPAWAERVAKLQPVRRDFQTVVLFTGLRSQDAATMRWEHVDLDAGTVHRPRPKGGVDRAFTVPVAGRVLDVLQNRRSENIVLFGDDGGWVFPARSRKTGKVSHLVEGRAAPHQVGVPTPHRLRDTFATAAREAGVGFLELKVLLNHATPSGDVTAGYIKPSVEHLRTCTERIAAFLAERTGARIST